MPPPPAVHTGSPHPKALAGPNAHSAAAGSLAQRQDTGAELGMEAPTLARPGWYGVGVPSGGNAGLERRAVRSEAGGCRCPSVLRSSGPPFQVAGLRLKQEPQFRKMSPRSRLAQQGQARRRCRHRGSLPRGWQGARVTLRMGRGPRHLRRKRVLGERRTVGWACGDEVPGGGSSVAQPGPSLGHADSSLLAPAPRAGTLQPHLDPRCVWLGQHSV